MARYSAGAFSVQEVEQVFGDLDVHRALKRGRLHYARLSATPKSNHVAFGVAIMEFQHRLSEGATAGELRVHVADHPEHLRGALIHWAVGANFMGLVLEEQRQNGFWPFDRIRH